MNTDVYKNAIEIYTREHDFKVYYLDFESLTYVEIKRGTGEISRGSLNTLFAILREDPQYNSFDSDKLKDFFNVDAISREVGLGDPFSIEFQRANAQKEYVFSEFEIIPQKREDHRKCAYLYLRQIENQKNNNYQLLRDTLEYAKEQRDEAEKAREQVETTLSLINKTMDSGFWRFEFNEIGEISEVYWSDEFRHMLGFESTNEFPNKIESWTSLLHPEDKANVLHNFYGSIYDYTGQRNFDVKYRLKNKCGEYVWFHAAGSIKRDKDGSPKTFAGVFININDKVLMKQQNETLTKEARQDALSGLYNRQQYENDMSENEYTTNMTYIALDINGLKHTNDTYGHDAGDELISSAAKILQEVYSPIGRVYRYGGDEFAVLTKTTDKRVLDTRKEEFDTLCANYRGRLVDKISISYGYASTSEYPGTTLSGLAKIADTLMYNDKNMYYITNGIDRRRN